MLKIKPLREPRANKISTTVFFYSRKLGRYVWCESNLEWDISILLENDLFVIAYCEQGFELEWSKSKWTPDFIVLFKDGDDYIIFIIEVKYLKDLLENRTEFVKKYNETKKWIKENEKTLISKLTDVPVKRIEFLVVTDQIVNQSFRIQNLRKLMEANINPMYYIPIKKHVEAVLTVKPEIKLKELVKSIALKSLPENTTEDDIWASVYYMIYNFELFIDLENLMTVNSAAYRNDNENIDYEPIHTWFKKYNWELQENYDLPSIPLVDIYGIGPTPEKSVALWEEANERLKIIKPLLDLPINDIKKMKFNNNWQTIYRWIRAYKKSGGDIRSLIPKYNERGRNNLKGEIFDELWKYGLEEYKKREKKNISHVHELVQAFALDKKQLDKVMSYSTLRRRFMSLHPKEVMESRDGKVAAEKQFDLSESAFPHGNYALETVQIDHTPIDLQVVDEEHRLVTERPFITIAFDCHTRCVLGYYITYDDPSMLSIGMTLLNCVQEKKEALLKVRKQFPNLDSAKMEILEKSEWNNVYGLPFTLHMDNGSDFRCDDLHVFGLKYKINLHYRAVKKPQHGAYIERMLGTLNARLHSIAGTTFSNTQERGDYPSEKKAIYTIDELEARVVTEIVRYHESFHSSLRTTPLSKWKESFSSDGVERGINRNLYLVNLNTFKFDVLPSDERTVQKEGVGINNLNYANERIEKWIGVKDPNDKKKSRKFRIRFDPRDIRRIWFYDDVAQEYVELKCNDKYIQTFFKDKTISLWDWKAIFNDQVIEGKKEEKVERKLRILSLQQEMDKEVAHRTKSARQRMARTTRRANDATCISGQIAESKGDDELEIKPELIKLVRPERVKKIVIPPDASNPFSGITRSKAKQLADK